MVEIKESAAQKVYGEEKYVLFARHPPSTVPLLIVREFRWSTRLIAAVKQKRLCGIELSF